MKKIFKKWRCHVCHVKYNKKEAYELKKTYGTDERDNIKCSSGGVLVINKEIRSKIQSSVRVLNGWGPTEYICGVCKSMFSHTEAERRLGWKHCGQLLQSNSRWETNVSIPDPEVTPEVTRRRLLASAKRAGAAKISDHLLKRQAMQ